MTKKLSQFLLTAFSLLILTATAHAASPPYVAVLNGSQETPSNSSTAVGNGLVILNSAENMITVSLKFSGLSANQTMAHIHGPAGLGETGPVLFDIGSSGTTSGTFVNLSFAITPQQVGYLRAGLLYFNVHSTALPNGEIRGQIQGVSNGRMLVTLQESNGPSVKMYLMNTDGSGANRLTTQTAKNEMSPVWSRDGFRVSYFYQGMIAEHFYAVNKDGSGNTLLTNQMTTFGFDWSPDGTKIAYSSNADIYTVSTDGLQTVTQLTNSTLTRDFEPSWSPDGSKIVFQRITNSTNETELYVMNSNGSGQTRITFDGISPVVNTSPAWSPDGKRIAYVGGPGNDLYVINPDGTGNLQLTNSPSYTPFDPSWSPDGSKIYFSYLIYQDPANSFVDEWDIYSVNPDGSALTLSASRVRLGLMSPTTVQPVLRPRLNRVSDFDGDGGTDIATWRPSDGIWRYVRSFDGTPRNQKWGDSALGDVPVPGDYDGDGRIDLTIFRPSEGNWYIINSYDSSLSLRGWGQTGDVPVPGDYDGDGRTDIAVYRPSEGNWYIINSSNNSITLRNWGIGTDRPVPADYDGDNRTDLAVFRPGDGVWYVIKSTGGATVQGWGQSTDKTVPGDYDGDRKADIAVYRPEEGNWYIIKSTGGISVRNWGASTDRPVPADYDNDGKTDIAIWRPGENTWYIINSSTNTIRLGFLGTTGDVLLPAAYVQ